MEHMGEVDVEVARRKDAFRTVNLLFRVCILLYDGFRVYMLLYDQLSHSVMWVVSFTTFSRYAISLAAFSQISIYSLCDWQREYIE